jgi:hypothetical protein
MYMYNGRAVRDTPVAMVDPDTGRVHCTPEGIVQAQANHTRTLGSQAAFAAAKPQFDVEWFEEVTASVAACREAAAAREPAAGPGTLDAPISGTEIHDALLTLKNGTAPSPVSQIPNELLNIIIIIIIIISIIIIIIIIVTQD